MGDGGERPRAPIALIGLRGAGKTSVGRELARDLDGELVDLDEELVALHKEEGGPHARAGDVLAAVGEAAFRELERRALVRVLTREGGPPAVIATGGGVVEREANRELLRERARCVWLSVEPAELARRVALDPTPRPPLAGLAPGAGPEAEARALLERRGPHYAALAELVVDAGERPPTELAREIATRLAGC